MSRTGSIAVERFAKLASTNDEALARARAGESGPLFIVAESQSGGRGRHGRAWASPPGNLYASLLLVDPCRVAVAPQLGFVAGVALARALRDLLDGDGRLQLKWPNDALFAGAKLAGLLLESTTTPQGRLACVIGFGVNCRSHPRDLPYPASDLTCAAGRLVEPDDVLARLAPAFEAQLGVWERGAGFALTRAAWLAFAAGLGDTVSVQSFSRTVTGTFSGIDPTGRLLVETAEGCAAIDAGDVFLRGAVQHDVTTRVPGAPDQEVLKGCFNE